MRFAQRRRERRDFCSFSLRSLRLCAKYLKGDIRPIADVRYFGHYHLMHVPAASALFLVGSMLAGCSEVRSEREELAGEIERSVVLPTNARALEDYERYYAKNADGSVSAVYIVHDEGHREAVARACREIDDAPFPCPVAGGQLRLVEAGESRWVDDAIDLPGMSGGGCSQVDISYQPRDGAFVRVECNGDY